MGHQCHHVVFSLPDLCLVVSAVQVAVVGQQQNYNNDSIRIHCGSSIMQQWHFQAVCDIVNAFCCIKLWTDAPHVLEGIC